MIEFNHSHLHASIMPWLPQKYSPLQIISPHQYWATITMKNILPFELSFCPEIKPSTTIRPCNTAQTITPGTTWSPSWQSTLQPKKSLHYQASNHVQTTPMYKHWNASYMTAFKPSHHPNLPNGSPMAWPNSRWIWTKIANPTGKCNCPWWTLACRWLPHHPRLIRCRCSLCRWSTGISITIKCPDGHHCHPQSSCPQKVQMQWHRWSTKLQKHRPARLIWIPNTHGKGSQWSNIQHRMEPNGSHQSFLRPTGGLLPNLCSPNPDLLTRPSKQSNEQLAYTIVPSSAGISSSTISCTPTTHDCGMKWFVVMWTL